METNGCSGVVKDSRSGTGSVIADNAHECTFIEDLSPDGTRWWFLGLSGIDGRLVAAPGIAAAASGKQDRGLAQLFLRERTAVTDYTWLDNGHLLLIAQRYQPHNTIGRQLELLCTSPSRPHRRARRSRTSGRRSARRRPARALATARTSSWHACQEGSRQPVGARISIRTVASPVLPTATAAACDRSMIRVPTYGPRSVTMTSAEALLARFVTRMTVPSGT